MNCEEVPIAKYDEGRDEMRKVAKKVRRIANDDELSINRSRSNASFDELRMAKKELRMRREERTREEKRGEEEREKETR
jgi:hypothetical protein